LLKLGCDFPQYGKLKKQRVSYVENVGIKRGNPNLTEEKHSLKNAVFIMTINIRKNSKINLFPLTLLNPGRKRAIGNWKSYRN